MDLISIIIEMYGFTKKEAKSYLRTITDKHKKELKNYFINNAKKCFKD